MDDFTEIESSDSIEYNKGIVSLKSIALEHIRKIGNMICQELTEGMWEKKPMKTAVGVQITNVYKPDLRIGYIQAVDFLADLIAPYSEDDNFKTVVQAQYDKDIQENYTIEQNLKDKRGLFRRMVIMFEDENFFNTETGRSDR